MDQLISIKGRFDGKPQRCSVTPNPATGSSEFVFNLQACSEDVARTLTVTLPSLQVLREEDMAVEVMSTSEDASSNEGFYGSVRLNEEERYVMLRVDHKVRLNFWMQADLSRVYFRE